MPINKRPYQKPASKPVNTTPRLPKPPKDTDWLEMDGEVKLHILGSDYLIQVEDIWEVRAYASGKMKFNKITITVWDKVKVKINPNDRTQWIITFRYK